VALIGLALAIRGPNRAAGLAVAVAAAISGWIVATDYAAASDRVAGLTSASISIVGSVGPGPYLAAIGVVISAVGSVMAILSKKRLAA